MTARRVATRSDEAAGVSALPDDRAAALAKKYRSLFIIGRGGMGAVEAALELRQAADDADSIGAGSRNRGNAQADYGRVVALKRLLPDAARDTRRVEMFLREARLAAMLRHPNVVTAFDYGEVDGELFLAMEYVEGQPLSRLLKVLVEKNEALDVSLAAYVLAEVCEGLHEAHELRGESGQPLALVHRDVSPQNVMLGYDGRVRLLDFGVAKIEAEGVTKTGEVKGKAAYMSPEQAMGDPLDRRSDLFGVGAVLFECLALHRMWGDGTDMDVIRRLALESPPKLEDARPDAPQPLCALYTRLVARTAAARPESAAAVAKALRGFLPGDGDAADDLRALLDRHFGAQRDEQRARLSDALERVAPAHATELRRSVAPSRPTTETTAQSEFENPRASAAVNRDEDPPGPRNRLRDAASVGLVLTLAAAIGIHFATRTTTPRSDGTDLNKNESSGKDSNHPKAGRSAGAWSLADQTSSAPSSAAARAYDDRAAGSADDRSSSAAVEESKSVRPTRMLHSPRAASAPTAGSPSQRAPSDATRKLPPVKSGPPAPSGATNLSFAAGTPRVATASPTPSAPIDSSPPAAPAPAPSTPRPSTATEVDDHPF